MRRVRLKVDPKASAFVIQTRAGHDIGAVGLLVEGPLAGITASFDSGRSADEYGADAVRVMTAGAFRSLPLVRVEAVVAADDAQSQIVYRRAGFRREGVIRAAIRTRAGRQDAVVFSRVRDDEA